jgi:hypothetical protein
LGRKTLSGIKSERADGKRQDPAVAIGVFAIGLPKA